ncbi:MAG: hypothetical protein MJ217_00635 [Bacilli bacterium]|nr:hypothetical protein [Bacilli bacterium]
MKKITKEILKISARNVMIDMSDEEYDSFLEDIEPIRRNLALLSEVDIPEDTIPMVFPYEIQNELAENLIDLEPLDKKEIFKNSNNFDGEYIKIKKVIK